MVIKGAGGPRPKIVCYAIIVEGKQSFSYPMLFTRSKDIDPSRINRIFKIAKYIQLHCSHALYSRLSKIINFYTKNQYSPTVFELFKKKLILKILKILVFFYLTLILLRLLQQHYCYNVTGQSQEFEGSCKPARIKEVHSKLHSLQASLCTPTATHLTLIYVCTYIRLSVPLET